MSGAAQLPLLCYVHGCERWSELCCGAQPVKHRLQNAAVKLAAGMPRRSSSASDNLDNAW
jgi:hypothetical protein